MATAVLIESTPFKLVTEDNTVLEFRLAYDSVETSNQPLILVHCYIDDELVGTPIRFKAAGDRIAADLPGVDSASFITEDGHITNG